MITFVDFSFFDSLSQFLIIGSIVFLSQFVYSVAGFGSGMVAISLLALLYGDIDQFVPFFILHCIPTELYVSIQDRDKIDYKNNWIFIAFIVPFLFLGSFMLKKQSNQILLVLLGLLIVSLAVYYLLYEDKIHLNIRNNRWWIVFFSALSGVGGGLFAIGGPPLIFYFKSIRLNKIEFRVALLSIFLAITIFRIIIYLILDFYSWAIVWASVLTFPFTLFGLYMGILWHHKISETVFKKLTSTLLLISGLLILLKSLMR